MFLVPCLISTSRPGLELNLLAAGDWRGGEDEGEKREEEGGKRDSLRGGVEEERGGGMAEFRILLPPTLSVQVNATSPNRSYLIES